MRSELNDVIEQFGLPEHPKTTPISKRLVATWMQSKDIEVLGALYAFITKIEYAKRIAPPLLFSDYFEFFLSYFGRCLREDPSGEWAHNRYEAAWEFASWFRALWKDKGVERRTFETLKTFLSDIYLNGDDAIRRCIVDGALEHMFENRDITKYFESWKKDPDFAVAFKEAVSWQGKNCKDEPS